MRLAHCPSCGKLGVGSCISFLLDRSLLCLPEMSASLWGPNYQLMLKFVLFFFHQAAWSRRLLRMFRPEITASRIRVSGVETTVPGHLAPRLEVVRGRVDNGLIARNSSSCVGVSSDGVTQKHHSYIFLYLCISVHLCTEYFLTICGLLLAFKVRLYSCGPAYVSPHHRQTAHIATPATLLLRGARLTLEAVEKKGHCPGCHQAG